MASVPFDSWILSGVWEYHGSTCSHRRTLFSTSDTRTFSGSGEAASPSSLRSSGRARRYGRPVWQEMQAVSWERWVLGCAFQTAARSSR